MTGAELRKLYEKVTDVIYHYSSYHVCYTYGNEYWSADDSHVSFDVYRHSDQGYGADWTEYWSINSDGHIFTDDAEYNSFEEFESGWG